MSHATLNRRLSSDTILQALGGTLGLIAVLLAVVVLAFSVAEVDGLGLSPIVVSTVVFFGLLVLVARLATRFIPRPA